ncbi:MAG: DUF1566 domain-containing protein [Pseudomonadota bacterium]
MRAFSAKIFAALLVATASSLTMAQEPAAPEQSFEDPATGLTWARCYAGSRIEVSMTNEEVPKANETCVGDAKRVSWFAATNIARTIEFDGKTGWRIPTRQEWDNFFNHRQIKKDLSRSMFPQTSSDMEVWTADRDPFSLLPKTASYYEEDGIARVEFPDPEKTASKSSGLPVILVLDKGASKSTSAPIRLELMSTRFFVDPATGLKWAPRLMGPTYQTQVIDNAGNRARTKVIGTCADPDSCYQADINLGWWESVAVVNDMVLDSQAGWRLPTRADLEAILPTLSTPGYPRDYQFLESCRTSDAGKGAGTVLVYDRSLKTAGNNGFIEVPADKKTPVCAVWGPSPSPEFQKLVSRALTWNGDAKYPVSDTQITATAQNIQQAQAAQKYMSDEQKKQQALGEQITRETAQRKARLNALRTNPKPGDKAQQGLVLETKGDLVRLQQHERVCVSTSGSACSEWRVRETGNQIWVRKSDLQLP